MHEDVLTDCLQVSARSFGECIVTCIGSVDAVGSALLVGEFQRSLHERVAAELPQRADRVGGLRHVGLNVRAVIALIGDFSFASCMSKMN